MELLRTRVTLTQRLTQYISADDLEIRFGQQQGTLAAESAEGCQHSDGNRVNNNGNSTIVSKKEEAPKEEQTSTGGNQDAKPCHVVRECSGG